jgi:hypothetical protein
MERRSLRAPSTDGALLADPPVADAVDLLAADRARLDVWDHDFQGRRASVLRPMVRGEVLSLARRFLASAGLEPADLPGGDASPGLVVTGHQPELFHPGVWIKNFATSWIARRAGAIGLNLIVDNDVPKATSVKVPREVGGSLQLERVAFDEWPGEIPYEDVSVGDEGLFASFAGRTRAALPPTIDDPVLDAFWPHALAARDFTPRTGLRFAIARRAVEQSWGVRNIEAPLSLVCETEGFLWFVSHLLAHLPRFLSIHNAALARYRALYRIRSRHHPVPELGRQDDWLEAPFWVWRASRPRRRPLLVKQTGRTMQIRIGGEDKPLLELPLAPDREACCAVERLRELPAMGVRLRTRALTTTMFARYLLGDLFLHGIGGAKYDELGDVISGQFFATEPPKFLTLSMTLFLGLQSDPNTMKRIAATDRALRDLTYNPDRWVGDSVGPPAAEWAARRRAAVEGPVATHAERLERFRAIRRCNEALQSFVVGPRAECLREREALTASAARFAAARSREYASVLHSQHRLRAALAAALPRIPSAPP